MEKIFIKGTCTDLTHEGLGVVKIDNKPYFIFDILPGESGKFEITKENKNLGYAKVVLRHNDSKNRIVPICKEFGKCGGCDFFNMDYDFEASYKLKMINETFKRIGHLDFQIKSIIKADKTTNYRNKVQIPFKRFNNKVSCGFYMKKSHDIIEINKCYLQTDLTTDIAKFTKNIMNDLKISAYDEIKHNGCMRHLLVRNTCNNEYMVVFIVNDYQMQSIKELAQRIKDRYKEVKSIILNINKEKSNVILGREYKVLYGNDYLVENILGLNFKMSHKAFFQINHDQTEKLYSKAIELANITKEDVVLDCYCGVGTISLLCAKYAKKVYGIEIVKEAIDDAKENALLNNIENAEFICAPAEEKINDLVGEIDVLVVDPPRKGLDKSLVDTLLNSNIKRIVYVSCDVATMARDLSLLTEKYELKDGYGVDLFPRTANVETVVLLQRK